jgi:hypothetical protein
MKFRRCYGLTQRFPNFFLVGATFISHNVLSTPLLLSALKANCLRFSTTVCDTQFTLNLFSLSFFFFTNVQSKRTTRAEPEDHLWSADHSLGNAGLPKHDVSSLGDRFNSVSRNAFPSTPRVPKKNYDFFPSVMNS